MDKKTKRKGDGVKLRVMSLGGLEEIGKNMTVLEYGDDIVVIDCGIGFPDDDMLGIDLVIPDVSYLEENSDKIRGLVLTHGHEDHIGSIAYLLRSVNVPVYGTRLTLGLVEHKLKEHNLLSKVNLVRTKAGETVKCSFTTPSVAAYKAPSTKCSSAEVRAASS